MISTKQAVLDRLTQDRAMLFQAIADLPDDELTRRPAIGAWSIKDILAHITAWDAETMSSIEQLMRGEHPAILDISDIDAWNTEHAASSWDASLPHVTAELIFTRQRLLDLVAGLSDASWSQPAPPPESPYRSFIVAELEMCAGHDREHAAPIMELKNHWIAGQQITPAAVA
jgi:hypothetical protein